MKINIYYWNNGVGVVTDSILLKSMFSNYDVIVYDVSKTNEYRKSDIGIFIQNIWADYLSHNNKNVYVVNEEWLTHDELSYFNRFDHIIVKSDYARQILNPYHESVTNTGFFSLCKLGPTRFTGNILHFKGRSIQKNHELAYKYRYKYNINIIDSETNYLTNEQVADNLNAHDIHICCSLYDAWGHYVWEAMSCGKFVICSENPTFKEYISPELVRFVPTKKTIDYDPEYRFLNSKNYPFRIAHFVNEDIFEETLDEKEKLLELHRQKRDEIIKFTKAVMIKNKTRFVKLIEDVT
jgi:hypothetical protein